MKFRSERTRIAVVGSAFRMPGVDREGFWEALLSGRNLISSVDPARWAQEPFLHSRKNEPGTSYTFAAGSLGDVSGFDAAFFGISPREAEQMDPQQRLLLEMTWEAFEDAAVRPSSLRGQRCGVYIGLSSLDYAYRRADDLGSIDATTMTGNAGSITANRISYAFDLHGPSMAIDTACSSSLVALHQACQSIRHGESDAAVVGGINLHLHPYAFIGFSKASMLSRHGRCSVFDEHGDGYVRSEGGAVLLLKPLPQAIADGNRILAVIVETGVNNDGRKTGLTVPSHLAQASLLREVYERAGVAPEEIDYVEAHGTGTAVGDPIEARAIGEALGQQRPPDRPLPIGSVKSNVGHLEAASGMAGLLKALHVLRHRRVPANIHLETANPNIDFAGWNLAPVTSPLDLDPDRRLIIGVSAFGFGGTNAHVVLSSFEAAVTPAATATTLRPPLMLSARSPAALKETARGMARFLRNHEDLAEYDIAYSALFSREIHPYRLAARCDDRAALAHSLECFAEKDAAPGIITGRFRHNASTPAFIYSGNGSQWLGMGLKLLEEEPAFRECLEEVDSLLMSLSGSSIIAALRAPAAESRLERTEVAQPALFAMQVALTRVFDRERIRPVAVCGHSVGEVAAAWASGALTLEAAVRVIHERSAHQASTRGHGCMAAIDLGEAETLALVSSLGLTAEIVIAAINTAASVTVAGSDSALAKLGEALLQRRVALRRLPLAYAFHSPAMDPVRAGLLHALRDLGTQAEEIPLYSTVTGAAIDGSELVAEHWWRNVREPVRFHAAIRAMHRAGINTFLEVGPRPVLSSYLNEIVKGVEPPAFVLPALTLTECGSARIRSVTEQLEVSGALHDPTRLFPTPSAQRVELPHYAWQRERHWHASTPESLGLLTRRAIHPLLGYTLVDGVEWENHLDTTRLAAYADHVVGGAIVFPAAGFAEMALAAADIRRPAGMPVIEDLEIVSPLLLERDHCKVVRLRVDAQDGRFTIVSRDHARDSVWHTHAVGRIVEESVPAAPPPVHLPVRAPDVSKVEHYGLAHDLGLQYGPAFQSVSAVWFCGDALIGALELPACAEHPEAQLLHPASLDGALQLLLNLARRKGARSPPAGLHAFLPVRIGRLELLRPHGSIESARAALRASARHSSRTLLADLTLCDASGAVVAAAHGVRFRAATLQRDARVPARWVGTRVLSVTRRDGPEAPTLISCAEAERLCAERLHAPARAAARQRFASEVEPLLDVLCAAFAERALRPLAIDAVIDSEQLRASGCVSAEGMPLLRRLLQILCEDGVCRASEGRWHFAPDSSDWSLPDPRDIWASLISDYPEYGAAIARVGAAGAGLAERLRAVASDEPRERRTIESAFSWVDASTHEEAAEVLAAVHAIASSPLAAGVASTSRARVLYIVGAAPREELGQSALRIPHPERADVTIAAPTLELLEEYRVRFPVTAKLARRVIDLDTESSDPVDARFDLAIVSAGLSDAANPVLRLRNIRRRLCDGGLIVFIEQHASRAADLVYGLNTDWWQAGVEHAIDGVPLPRRRAPDEWVATLSHAGFSNVQTVCDAPGVATGPYVLIARATAAAYDGEDVELVPSSAARTSRTWLLVQDEAGDAAVLGAALSAELARHGDRSITVTASGAFRSLGPGRFAVDAASASSWAQLLDEIKRSEITPDGWVHLAGLQCSGRDAQLEARLRAAEARAAVLMAWLQACADLSLRPECWVIGSGADPTLGRSQAPNDPLRDAALHGLTRVAMQEFAETRIRSVDLLGLRPGEMSPADLVREMLSPDEEDELLLGEGSRFAPRLEVTAEPPSTAPVCSERPPAGFRLDFLAPGSFRNLEWRPQPVGEADPILEPDELEIEVRAAGLNFRDVMYAMGLLPDEAVEGGFCGPTLGMELAGVVLRTGCDAGFNQGDEVIAIAPASFADRVRTRAFAVTRKPTDWSFAAAATVPTAFFTAYYALVELARLESSQRVLIHGAAGGVGIAAIQIAKHLGAEVFATAGTAEKREFVRLLGAERVFDSRSLAFADEILHATSGTGVDVVLNSLSGEAMQRSVALLRPFGRMIELGKRDFYENTRMRLRPFRNNITYLAVDADQLIAQRPDLARRVLGELMQLFAQRRLRPLPHRSFCATDIEAAFRHMQASRHIGKLVITFPRDFRPLEADAEDRPLALRTDATYLVTGGLSGFGCETARWLAAHGARHLVLISRRGAIAEDAQQAVRELTVMGVAVKTAACDVADRAALAALFAEVKSQMPPIRGVVHAAMVIEDALIRDMNLEQLRRVLAPKMKGGWHLHEATRELDLDFFLLYSSATTLFGNPGQAAYVAANMTLEALAAERRQLGLPVTCVSLGPIGDTGYLARHEKVRDALLGRMGGRALGAAEALRAIEPLLALEAPTAGLMDLEWNVLGRFLPKARAPKFSQLAQQDGKAFGASDAPQELARRLAQLPDHELQPAIIEVIRGEVAQILRLAPERIDASTSLFDMGMDSLMAVELSMSLETRIGIQLSALSLSDRPTIERIAARLAQQLRPADERASTAIDGDAPLADQVRSIAAQHASAVSEKDATELTADLRSSAPPISLTYRSNS